MERIPPLHPKPPGIGLRSLGLVLPGVRQISAQIEPYTKWWSDQNQTALKTSGPLLVAIGDSTAIGIGASAPDRSYVGLIREALDGRDRHAAGERSRRGGTAEGNSWQVINLAQSGARAADGLERQLPILNQLIESGRPPALTICSIGSNDVVWSKDTTVLRNRLRSLIEQLPAASLLGLVAGGSPRAALANRAVKGSAVAHGHHVINPWREPGPATGARLASDRFHPNDTGYALMARPFARHLGAPEPEVSIGEADQPEEQRREKSRDERAEEIREERTDQRG